MKVDEQVEGDSYEAFAKFLETDAQLTEPLVLSKIDSLCLKTDKAAAVMVQCFFNEGILELVESKASLFQSLVKDKKVQRGLLGGLERLIGVQHPDSLLPKTALVLKAFYDEDLLEEDVIVEWYGKISKKYVNKVVGKQLRERAAKFMEWLQ